MTRKQSLALIGSRQYSEAPVGEHPVVFINLLLSNLMHPITPKRIQ